MKWATQPVSEEEGETNGFVSTATAKPSSQKQLLLPVRHPVLRLNEIYNHKLVKNPPTTNKKYPSRRCSVYAKENTKTETKSLCSSCGVLLTSHR
jgi:hypothetical protein